MSKRVSAPFLLALGSLVAGACGDGPSEPSLPPPLVDHIVYTESNGPSLINQVAVRHPDGTGYRVLTAPDSLFVAPLISPDGRRIAFSHYQNGTLDLYVMNSEGAGRLRLTDTPQANETAADWTPDGATILYGEATAAWYQVRPDGSDRHEASIPADADSPRIARDGSAVTFFAFRDNQMDVFTAGLDGSNVTNLTGGAGLNFWPSWSPDGSRIAFVSTRANTEKYYDLYSMARDGSDVRVVALGVGPYPASWSPDGRELVFARGDLFVVEADGTGLRNITNTPEWIEEYPSWSPVR